tara:strand:+ start:73535 stop:74374 length:840 start_codon:yes stop_codon:yes gene_type:complete
MKEKYVIKTNKFKPYVLILYFFSIIFFIIAFSFNIEIPKKIIFYGQVNNYISNTNFYSNVKGRITELYITYNQKIETNQKIADIFVESDNNVDRENLIIYYETLLKKTNDNKKIEDYKNKISKLKKITNKKSLYFKEQTSVVNDVFIKKNDIIEYNQILFNYNNNTKENLFYIEAYVSPENFSNIYEGNEVLIEFYQLPNKSIKYQGIIDKKYKEIFNNNIVFKKTNGKLNQLAYKVNIRILNTPEYVKEGIGVKVLLLQNKITLFDYIFKKVNDFYGI